MFEITDLTSLKIMLVDDHVMFSQGLSELLKKILPTAQIKVFSSPEKAKEDLLIHEYNFLLCDIIIPGYNAKDFIIDCKKKHPLLNIITVSSVIEIQTVKEFLSIGINGYLTKAVNAAEIKLALEKIYSGEKYISSDIAARLSTSLFEESKSPLTKKEIEILRMIAAGDNVIKTAEKLHISTSTVMSHRRNIMTKLDLHSAGELVKYAFENNLV